MTTTTHDGTGRYGHHAICPLATNAGWDDSGKYPVAKTRCTCDPYLDAEPAPVLDQTSEDWSSPCPTSGCHGDRRYAAPGRGHADDCRYPIDQTSEVR